MQRGIVTCAGGSSYFLNAYLNIWQLRNILGCALPVEWFCIGEQELTPYQRERIEELPLVTIRVLSGYGGDHRKIRGGWQSKSRAMQASSFDEFLWLDADCFPVRDPTPLFTHPKFNRPAIFWPDNGFRFGVKTQQAIWETYRVKAHNPQVESGVILIRAKQCREMLNKAVELNLDGKVYGIVFGDKDTFPIACNITRTPFRIIGHFPRQRGGYQHVDFDGRRAFQHLIGAAKWRWDGHVGFGGFRAIERIRREIRRLKVPNNQSMEVQMGDHWILMPQCYHPPAEVKWRHNSEQRTS
jgi:alpha 1,2-mannosyltransferase